MGTLSGGQIKRVALAKLLYRNQSRTQTRLVDYGRTYQSPRRGNGRMARKLSCVKTKITLLLVTHDRYFLDSVCDTVWEMEDQNLYVHQGSYATYLENKMIREDNLNATIDKANNLYRKELEWMHRQPKARTTKSKSRIDAFYDTEKSAKTNTKKQS